jgi:hypothetical protein
MNNIQKSKSKNKYAFLFLGAVILAVGFFSYQSYAKKQAAMDDATDTFEEGIPAKCENGDWIEFPDPKNPEQYEKFAGNEKLKYNDKKNIFTSEDGAKIVSTDKNYSLLFFMDRRIWLEGYKLSDKEIYAKKIKCVGEEADKDIVEARRKLMNYIRDNINTLALEEAPKGDWQVETFYFASDTDVYVQYETEGSFMEDAPYDSHLWLIRASGLERNIPEIKTLAYIQEDAENPEKNILKQGEDLYKETKNLTVYEFDEEANQWTLQ